MSNELLKSVRLTVGTIAVSVVGYAILILVIAAIAAPEKRMGSLIFNESGKIIGSRMVAQAFTRPEYLWPRPSAVDYDAAGAGGSNLSPASPLIRERAEEIIARLAPSQQEQAPTDLLLASGAGLDPHITQDAALFQARRVADARQISENEVRRLIEESAIFPAGGGMADMPLINVLEFNLLLDKQFPRSIER